MFRGMAASRLGILLDGEMILGGCGMRMDPPTAYVFPEAFDRITVLQGPQTVKYGPGNSAGVVRFERSPKPAAASRPTADASLLVGNFGRNDQMFEAGVGNERFYGELTGTHSHAQDYRDGKAAACIHLRPLEHQRRPGLDARRRHLARTHLRPQRRPPPTPTARWTASSSTAATSALKFEKQRISPLLAKLEAQVYHNYVDHVMDNYTPAHAADDEDGEQPGSPDPGRSHRRYPGYHAARTSLETGLDSSATTTLRTASGAAVATTPASPGWPTCRFQLGRLRRSRPRTERHPPPAGRRAGGFQRG